MHLSTFWVFFALGVVAVGLPMFLGLLQRVINGGQQPVASSVSTEGYIPSARGRLMYNLVLAVLMATPLAAALVAPRVTSRDPWPITLLLVAAVFSVVGLVPALIAILLGPEQFRVFKFWATYRSRTSFRTLAVTWLMAVCLPVGIALQYLWKR